MATNEIVVTQEDNGRCPNCGEDELDGGECYYCGWGKEGFKPHADLAYDAAIRSMKDEGR